MTTVPGMTDPPLIDPEITVPGLVIPVIVTTLDVVPSAQVKVGRVREGVVVIVGIETEPELLLVILEEPLDVTKILLAYSNSEIELRFKDLITNTFTY